MTRDDAIKKIKKCLALSRSANEHEAAAALRQAQKLMSEHGLAEQDMSLADVREAGAKARSSANNLWEWHLVELVKNAFGCEVYRNQAYTSSWNITHEWVFVGVDGAADIAAYAADVLLRQCAAARKAHIAKQPKNCKAITKTARGDAFAKGWVWGASAAVQAFAQTDERKALLLTYMERAHPELQTRKTTDKSKLRKLDSGHMMAGVKAGREAELHRGVGAASQPLAIGG
jgi:hypothetical protein